MPVIRAFLTASRKDGVTAPYIAAQKGDVDVIKCLLEAFRDALKSLPEEGKASATRAFLTASYKDGATALHIAAHKGHVDVIKCLLEAFSEAVETEAERVPAIRAFLTASRKDGATALFFAAQNGHVDVVKDLLGAFREAVENLSEAERVPAIRAFLTASCKDGATALFIAAQEGRGAVLSFLLEQGVDPEQKWVMCFLGKYRVFKWLFVKSPLTAARQSGHLFTEALLERAIQERKTAVKTAEIWMEEGERLMPGTAVTAL